MDDGYGDRVVLAEGGDATVLLGGGETIPFNGAGPGVFAAPEWSQDELSGDSESGFTLVRANGSSYDFAGSGALQAIVDRNGNETSLEYTEAGRLKRITDESERPIVLSYDEAGLVESAEDPMGHIVTYGYEGGDLTSVTMPGEEAPRWQFEYDGSHRLTKMIDGRGGETTNEYDAEDRVIAQTDPAERTLVLAYEPFHTRVTDESTGAVTDQWFTSNNEPFEVISGVGTSEERSESFAYDDGGHLLEQADGNGHTTVFTYNAAGDRRSVTDPNENETSWTYNAAHDVLTETTPRGETTTIVRDGAGNPEVISRPAPGEATQTIELTYEAHGKPETMKTPLGKVWEYEYDTNGNRDVEIDPEGDERTFVYDENSQLESTVSPRGNALGGIPANFETSIERDPQGRPLKTTDPLGHVNAYVYDGNGNLEASIDPKNHETIYEYDPMDRLVSTEEPNGDTTKTKYDGAGQVIGQTDGNGETTTYVRDALGQPTEIVDPLERVTANEYDDAGNLIRVIDAAERQTTYEYDPGNRLAHIDYSEEATADVGVEYDQDGNLIAMIDGSGESTYDFDQLGRLEETENGNGDVIAYEYNLGDQLEAITYPNGKEVTHGFDDAGRMTSLTDWLGRTTEFVYDPDSNLEETVFPAAAENVDSYDYDNAGQMVGITMAGGEGVLATIDYVRDKAGLVESEARSGLPGASEVGYGYDENNRLVEAGPDSFAYDKADNLIKSPSGAFEYDKASQLETGPATTFEFDALGQRTVSVPSSGPTTSYSYDQAGDLTSVERPAEGEAPAIDESFAFDGTGLMTARTVGEATSQLTWDVASSLPLLLYDEDNNYIYGPGGVPVAQISSEEAPSFYHHDQLGSSRLLTDGSGEVDASMTYSPYGELEASSGSIETPMLFAGQYTGAQSALQYLRARFYDPETAQFISTDPLGAVSGTPYAYVGGNPANRIDPSGLFGLDDVGGFLAESAESLNPIKYYEEEVECIEEGCSYWESVFHGAQGAVTAACDVSLVGAAGKAVLGRGAAKAAESAAGAIAGSTGRTEAKNLTEQLAMKEAMSNPAAGTKLEVVMADSRWPSSEGWVKMAENINGVEVHWVYNPKTRQAADFKFIDR